MKERVALLDVDGKIPILTLQKISAYEKARGNEVILNCARPETVDRTYISVIFEQNRPKAELYSRIYPNATVGGTGWDLTTELPPEIEAMRPDYDLYTAEDIYHRICRGVGTKEAKMQKAQILADGGIGFTTRGCVRTCGFCVVPKKEGGLRQASTIAEIINPRSNVITLLDNNFTADPEALPKLREIKERKLVVNISQGIDVRLVTPELARALSEVRHLRSLVYAWDLIGSERQVLDGIRLLSRWIRPKLHMCFTLVGFNTTFEEDLYRFHKLLEMKVDPFVMVYNKTKTPDARLNHYARWVNGRFHKTCDFEEYTPWVKARAGYFAGNTTLPMPMAS